MLIAYDYEWLFVALDLTAIPIRPFMCDLHCSTAMALFTILFFPFLRFCPIDCTKSSAYDGESRPSFALQVLSYKLLSTSKSPRFEMLEQEQIYYLIGSGH